MSVMIQVNGYLGWCSAERTNDNKWIPVVWFERLSDHQKPLVPAQKHTIQHNFDSEDDAIQAALAYGHQKAEANDTGLE